MCGCWETHPSQTEPGSISAGLYRWVDDMMEVGPEYWLNDSPYVWIEYEGASFTAVLHNPRRLIIFVPHLAKQGNLVRCESSTVAGASRTS